MCFNFKFKVFFFLVCVLKYENICFISNKIYFRIFNEMKLIFLVKFIEYLLNVWYVVDFFEFWVFIKVEFGLFCIIC